MDLDEVLAPYLGEIRPAHSMAKATRESWAKFIAFCHRQGLERLEQLTSAEIDAFHQKLLWEPNSLGQLYRAHSVAQFLVRVRQILRWAHRSGFIDHDPCAKLKLSGPNTPTCSLLTWDELQAFLASLDRTRPAGLRDAALFTLVTETPLGMLQSLELQLGQEELLDLEPPTRELLAQYVRESRPLMLKEPTERTLFLSQYGRPIGRTVAGNMLFTAARHAGFQGQVTARSLRRSYLAHLKRQAQNRHFSFNRNGL
jgi:site-specific recombinase XerD